MYVQHLVPSKNKFSQFECYSLVTNVKLKNQFSIQFKTGNDIPTGKKYNQYFKIMQGGKLILFVPTANEEGEFLFDDDLGTGFKNGDPINCYTRFGFLNNVILSCKLQHGNRIKRIPV